ncbi:hypothetical protein ACIBCA_03070 [Kitasatospora sp. NPDC051170]|uniref:hypothetical protein n=1 Tax=Kitasatospora sp. NPDC051170 TaxID=3364056 RepID=UPI0037A55361
MRSTRIAKTLAVGAALALSALAAPSATAATAPGAALYDCSDYYSVSSSNVNLYGYVGYVDLQYSPGCHATRSHFHVADSFRNGHSGWNVRLWVDNGRNADSTAQNVLVEYNYPNNTSYADYWSPSTSIYGNPTEVFTAGVTWTYNACRGEWISGWHDYSNGYNFNDGGASSYSQGCHG